MMSLKGECLAVRAQIARPDLGGLSRNGHIGVGRLAFKLECYDPRRSGRSLARGGVHSHFGQSDLPAQALHARFRDLRELDFNHYGSRTCSIFEISKQTGNLVTNSYSATQLVGATTGSSGKRSDQRTNILVYLYCGLPSRVRWSNLRSARASRKMSVA